MISMYNAKSKFHKGSSVLVSTLITAAASAMIGYGITKMIATGIDSINNQQVKMQAQQYAASRINVLRSVRYDNLAGMTKRQIGTTDYYEEVTKTGDSDGSTGDAYQVAIYKGADSSNPVTTMNFYRSNPGILLDNQVESGSDNADSSALIQSALKDYTNSQFGEGSESESSSKAMGIKSFTSYVDGLLSKYRINAVAAWNIDSSDTFNQNGSDRKPIYIEKGSRYNYAAQGSVTYSMSGKSEGYLATVTKDSNGLYYVDYIEKDTPDESTGGGTGGGSTSGPSSNENLPDAETSLFYKSVDSGRSFSKVVDIKIPEGCKVLSISSDYWTGGEAFDGGVFVKNVNSSKVWINSSSANVLIGVTSGKVYSLQIGLSSNDVGSGDDTYDRSSASLGISYSKSINEKTPDITDY